MAQNNNLDVLGTERFSSDVNMANMFNAVQDQQREEEKRYRNIQSNIEEMDNVSRETWEYGQANVDNLVNDLNDNLTAKLKNGKGFLTYADKREIARQKQEIEKTAIVADTREKEYNKLMSVLQTKDADKYINIDDTWGKINEQLYSTDEQGNRVPRDPKDMDFKNIISYKDAYEDVELKVKKRNYPYADEIEGYTNAKGGGRTTSGRNFISEDDAITAIEDDASTGVSRKTLARMKGFNSYNAMKTYMKENGQTEDFNKMMVATYYNGKKDRTSVINKANKEDSGSNGGFGSDSEASLGGDNAVRYNTIKLHEIENAEGDKIIEEDESSRSNIYSLYNMPIGKKIPISIAADGYTLNLSTGEREKRTGLINMDVSSIGVFPTIKKQAATKLINEATKDKTRFHGLSDSLRKKIALLGKGVKEAFSDKEYNELEKVLGDDFDKYVTNDIFAVGKSSDIHSENDNSINTRGEYAAYFDKNTENAFRAAAIEKGYSKELIDKRIKALRDKINSRKVNNSSNNNNNTAAPKESEIVSEDEFFKS